MKPSQLNRILVPIDFSAVSLTALDQASFLARLFKADLYVLHVIDIPPAMYPFDDLVATGLDTTLLERTVTGKCKDLQLNVRKEHGLNIKTIVRRGRTADEIVSAVKENKIDVVVMGTHGASGFDEYFIGSNAHKLITLCPCPVISVQRKSKKLGYSNILLPIDNSMHSREKVNYVLLLAKKFGSVIHILGLPDDDDALHKKQFALKVASVEKLVKKAGLACTVQMARKGNIAELALKYAKKTKSDLIAIMTDHESEYGIFIGPFTKQIVNHSKIPVLSIKPSEGEFESVKPY